MMILLNLSRTACQRSHRTQCCDLNAYTLIINIKDPLGKLRASRASEECLMIAEGSDDADEGSTMRGCSKTRRPRMEGGARFSNRRFVALRQTRNLAFCFITDRL